MFPKLKKKQARGISENVAKDRFGKSVNIQGHIHRGQMVDEDIY
jgi:hypothetical protein